MIIEILTLFPQMFSGPFDQSIIKRARDKNLVEIRIHNLRDFGLNSRKTVDDKPYGGGTGMILRVDVVAQAIEHLKKNDKNAHAILLTPQGQKLNQKLVQNISRKKHLILICGHYEGIDERIRSLVDQEISIGDYVLTGGELPAMVLTDALIRLIPRVLSKEEATQTESFQEVLLEGKEVNLLEYPQYTRPEEFQGLKVPQILLSGHHEKINKWRLEQSLKKTKNKRPDLLKENCS